MWVTCLQVVLQPSLDCAFSRLHPCKPMPSHLVPGESAWPSLHYLSKVSRPYQPEWVSDPLASGTVILFGFCLLGLFLRPTLPQLVSSLAAGTRPQTQWTFAIEAKTTSARMGEWPACQWMELHRFPWSVPRTLPQIHGFPVHSYPAAAAGPCHRPQSIFSTEAQTTPVRTGEWSACPVA